MGGSLHFKVTRRVVEMPVDISISLIREVQVLSISHLMAPMNQTGHSRKPNEHRSKAD